MPIDTLPKHALSTISPFLLIWRPLCLLHAIMRIPLAIQYGPPRILRIYISFYFGGRWDFTWCEMIVPLLILHHAPVPSHAAAITMISRVIRRYIALMIGDDFMICTSSPALHYNADSYHNKFNAAMPATGSNGTIGYLYIYVLFIDGLAIDRC